MRRNFLSRVQSWPKRFAPMVLVAITCVGSAHAQSETATDLDLLLERIRGEVELLRFHMGKPLNGQAPPAVDEVQPHEAFLQAQNLFRKANRLGRELVDSPRRSPPVAPEGVVMIANVLPPLEGALAEILTIKSELGITDRVEPPERVSSRGLTSVYRATVQTNRQLNLMTERDFDAGDVFGQISLAITYAGGILSAHSEADAIPEAPAFEAGKLPEDVYRQLSRCLRLNREIAESIQFEILRYDPRDFRRGEVLPSDVYDLATLLVSYVGHLASTLEAPEIYPDIEKPEHIFHSHAYQHAGVLHEQLAQIVELVE